MRVHLFAFSLTYTPARSIAKPVHNLEATTGDWHTLCDRFSWL
jgi:hypothetical protein